MPSTQPHLVIQPDTPVVYQLQETEEHCHLERACGWICLVRIPCPGTSRRRIFDVPCEVTLDTGNRRIKSTVQVRHLPEVSLVGR